jgi:hypothetical protein
MHNPDPLGNPLDVYASLTEANINANIDGAGMGNDNPIDLISSASGTVEEAIQPDGFSDDEELEEVLAEWVDSDSDDDQPINDEPYVFLPHGRRKDLRGG